ncbi:hypothetical protein C2E23DRAFT_724218 [Lenzites betulinus]|nr:hypothetical protein C2E23DRAFT_724218 [Lenzites betulinus]
MADSDSPSTSELDDLDYGDCIDYMGDIFSYRDRPLALTICIAIGDQPLPRVSVRVFHDREYTEDEAELEAEWRAYARRMERRLAVRLSSIVRDMMVDSLLRRSERRVD